MNTVALHPSSRCLAMVLRGVLLALLAAPLFSPANSAPAGRALRLESEHFIVSYDPDRLSASTAREALGAAERGYAHSLAIFQRAPAGRILCDLTPRFFGATGFAHPSARPLRIGVRYPDLEYLGLSGEYVLAHEIAHIFSGRDAEGPLGEGLADFVAGSLHEMPLAPWWGRALRERGLWTEADGLFVSGEYPAANELDARVRISQYTQPALLLQYLSRRFGFDRVGRFLPDYGKARHSLASNDAASARPAAPPGGRAPRPRRPDPERVRSVFQEHFGLPWEQIRDAWLREMEAAEPPTGAAERLVLQQEIYASIRGYEGWLMRERRSTDDALARAIRAAFTRANSALRKGDTGEARVSLRVAQRLIDSVRRPVMTADAKLLHRFGVVRGLY